MAGVTFDITAKIQGYEDSLAKLRKGLQSLDPGSDLAKSIKKGLESAEAQVKALGKNLKPQITNENQLDRLTEKVNTAGNAIAHLGSQMKDATKADINVHAIQGFDELSKKIQELQAQLESGIQDKFVELIKSSTELSNAFSALNIDITNKDSAQIVDELNDKLKEATKTTQDYTREYNKAVSAMTSSQSALDAIKVSPFAAADSKADLLKEIQGLSDAYNVAFKDLGAKMSENLQKVYGDKGIDTKELLNTFFAGLNSHNIEEHIRNLMSSLHIQKGDVRNFYKQIFGADETSSRDINTLIKSLGLPPIEEMQAKLREYVEKISAGGKYSIKGSDKTDLLNFIRDEDVEGMLKMAEKVIVATWKRVQDTHQRESEKFKQANTRANDLEVKKQEAEAREKLINDAVKGVEKAQGAAETSQPMVQLGQEIDEEKGKLEQLAEQGVKTAHEVGDGAEKAGHKWHMTGNEIDFVSRELEKVKQREQLVGKVEGLIKRWFSIYAAVRMVSNAIKSMIATVKELDKTITDIAIVTDMSQSDLWGQMPQYTAMAQQYAVSISGVYKVSQLYYQQGLQTVDVMKLSAETLKMARIAGIDYADAADYMTNAVRSFKMEMSEATRVTDAYSALAASSAVTVSELAEAMSKTASSAYGVGASLENTAAMISVMTEATRESASNIGSALKSIISRYGEMKASPKDILNIDGEEASFNKVDTALKSIGISLKDAQGQFRNFDDVIMELSRVWSTLDNNTQRYIATIMAGNRQQSRFLALVSSYDRLKELTAIAADSENAAQEQFLKTLDSIEAKTQQLQTSLQSLYAGTGIEQIYKLLLDVGANVLDYFNRIADTFNGGVAGGLAAVANFGAQFWNLANVVLTIFRVIKTRNKLIQDELTALNQKANKEREQNQLNTDAEMNAKRKVMHEQAENQMTQATLKEAKKRVNAVLTTQQKAGMGLSLGGAAASMFGASLENKYWSSGFSLGGSILSGIGTGLMSGSVWMGVLSAVMGALGPALDLMKDLIDPMSEYEKSLEKAKEAQEKFNAAQQKAQNSTKTVKNLEAEIDKLDELNKHKYDSVDAYKAYEAEVASLTEAYPDLIKYYDAEGKAISLSRHELELYLKTQKEKAREDRKAAAKAKALVDEEYIAIADSIQAPKTAADVSKDAGDTSAFLGQAHAYLDRGQSIMDAIYNALPTLYNGILNIMTEEEYSQVLGIQDINDTAFKNKWIAQGKQWYDGYKETAEYKNFFTRDTGNNADNYNVLYNVLKDFEAYAEQKRKSDGSIDYIEAWDTYAKEVLSGFEYDQAASYIRNIILTGTKKQLEATAGERGKERALEYVRTTINDMDFEDTMVKLYAQQNQEKAIIEQFYSDEEKLRSMTYEEANKRVEEVQAAMESYEAEPVNLKEFYGKATEEQQTELKEKIIPNITEYSLEQIQRIIQDYGLVGSQAEQTLITYFKDQSETYRAVYEEAQENSNSYLRDTLLKDDYLTKLAPTVLYEVQTQASQLQSELDSSKNEEAFKGAVDASVKFFDAVAFLANTDKETYALVQSLISSYGITSLSGLMQIKHYLPETDIGETLSAAIDEMADYTKINLASDLPAYVNSIAGQYENISKILDKASKGMTVNEATVLANRLGITLDNFYSKEGKLYLNDFEVIYNAYDEFEEYWQRLSAEYQVAQENGKATDELQKAYQTAILQRAENRALLIEHYFDVGNVDKAIELILRDTDFDAEEIAQQIKNGNYNNLPQEMQAYLSRAIEGFNNINKSVAEAFINSLDGKGAQIISGEDIETSILNDKAFANLFSYNAKNNTYTIDLAKATSTQLKALYQSILHNLTLPDEDKQKLLDTISKEIYDEKNSAKPLKEIIDSYNAFDEEIAFNYAKSLDKELADLIREGNIIYNSVTGKYSLAWAALNEELQKLEVSNAMDAANIADSLRGVFTDIAEKAVAVLEEDISTADWVGLNEALQKYGLSEFQVTKDGSNALDAVISLYYAVDKVDHVASQVIFDSLQENLSKAGLACDNISETMGTIGALQNKIKNSSEGNTQEYKNQLDILQKIAKVQMNEPKSYDFMNYDVPSAMQSPATYWGSVSKMTSVLKQAAQDQYMEYEDFYNITTYLNHTAALGAENVSFAGRALNGSFEDAANLIEEGYGYLKEIDGKTVVDLAEFGIDFANGSDEMATGIDEGIKKFAESQKEILDSLINYLEVVVAMEKLEKDGKIDLGELFDGGLEQGEGQKVAEQLLAVAESSEVLKKALQGIQLTNGTESMSLFDALTQLKINPDGLAEEWWASFEEAIKQFHTLMGQKDWDLYDTTAIEKKINNGKKAQLDNAIEYAVKLSVIPGDMQLSAEEMSNFTELVKTLVPGSTINGSIPITDGATVDYTVSIDSKTGNATVQVGDLPPETIDANSVSPTSIAGKIQELANTYSHKSGAGSIPDMKTDADTTPVELEDKRSGDFAIQFTATKNASFAVPNGEPVEDKAAAIGLWNEWIKENDLDELISKLRLVRADVDAEGNFIGLFDNPKTYANGQAIIVGYKIKADGTVEEQYAMPPGKNGATGGYTSSQTKATQAWADWEEANDLVTWAEGLGFTVANNGNEKRFMNDEGHAAIKLLKSQNAQLDTDLQIEVLGDGKYRLTEDAYGLKKDTPYTLQNLKDAFPTSVELPKVELPAEPQKVFPDLFKIDATKTVYIKRGTKYVDENGNEIATDASGLPELSYDEVEQLSAIQKATTYDEYINSYHSATLEVQKREQENYEKRARDYSRLKDYKNAGQLYENELAEIQQYSAKDLEFYGLDPRLLNYTVSGIQDQSFKTYEEYQAYKEELPESLQHFLSEPFEDDLYNEYLSMGADRKKQARFYLKWREEGNQKYQKYWGMDSDIIAKAKETYEKDSAEEYEEYLADVEKMGAALSSAENLREFNIEEFKTPINNPAISHWAHESSVVTKEEQEAVKEQIQELEKLQAALLIWEDKTSSIQDKLKALKILQENDPNGERLYSLADADKLKNTVADQTKALESAFTSAKTIKNFNIENYELNLENWFPLIGDDEQAQIRESLEQLKKLKEALDTFENTKANLFERQKAFNILKEAGYSSVGGDLEIDLNRDIAVAKTLLEKLDKSLIDMNGNYKTDDEAYHAWWNDRTFEEQNLLQRYGMPQPTEKPVYIDLEEETAKAQQFLEEYTQISEDATSSVYSYTDAIEQAKAQWSEQVGAAEDVTQELNEVADATEEVTKSTEEAIEVSAVWAQVQENLSEKIVNTPSIRGGGGAGVYALKMQNAISLENLEDFIASNEGIFSYDAWKEKFNLDKAGSNAVSDKYLIGEFEKLGLNLSEGIDEGFLKDASDEDITKKKIENLENLIKQYAGISSPAEKFKPLGKYIAEGIGEGIASGDLTPYIRTLIEKALGINLGHLGTTNTKILNKGVASNNQRDSIQALINETEQGNSSIITAIETLQKAVKLPTLQELRQALDGIATHTDFLLDGSPTANNFVLATGEGNQHYNVQMDKGGVSLVPAERNTEGYHDTIVIPFESDTTELDATVTELENKQVGIPVEATNLAAFKNQILAYIRAIAGTQIGMDIYVQSVTADGVTSNSTANSITAGINKTIAKFGQAKGNVAFSKGTLMGELGPELYVTGGHYYIAGEKGAEFVDLPEDAIVFNHLQTKRLMKTGSAGRGNAVTNEKKATSFATGNVAMASASETLASLKQLRAMWDRIAEIGAKDLATKGGGGGGGGGKDEAINLHDLDRWYNLMRQIEKIEEQITYQQKLRENMRNGGDYIKSMEYELALLEKEQSNYQLLSELQKSYYEARRRDQAESIYGKIFTYDEDGLMQYVDGAFRDVLAKMEEQRTTGVMKYTNAQQKKILTNYLLAQGVSQQQINDTLNIKTDGTKVENDEEWIENFWDKFDGWIEEMDSMYDSYNDYQTKVQEMIAEQNKILEEYRDLQLDLEQQLLKAIEDREQAVIDKLQDTYDAINDSSQKYIDGLSDALSRERDMYNRNQDSNELAQLQRRLAILQRSGGSGAEILSLQKQIESQLQENYFSEQQSQIDAIKEASDAQLEKLQQQIDIAQETLEYQKENGLFWAEVTAMMQNWEPNQLADFIAQHNREMFSKSPLDVETTMAQTLMDFEKWYELRNRFGAFNDWYDNTMTKDVLKNEYGVNTNNKTELERTRAIAKAAYQRYYAEPDWAQENGYASAEEAAIAALKAERDRRAGAPKDYTQGVGSTSSSSSSGGNNNNSSNNASQLNALKQAVDTAGTNYKKAKAQYNTAKAQYDGYNKTNKMTYGQWLQTPEGEKAVQFGNAPTEYNWYETNFNKNNPYYSAMQKAEQERERLKKIYEDAIDAYVKAGGDKNKLTTYTYGGMVDTTGIALVHAKEGVLKPEQVEQLRALTLANKPNSIAYQVAQLTDLFADVAPNILSAENGGSIVIENATVEMNVGSIANDYEARRAGEQALEAMMEIARKTSVQSIRR